MKRAIALAGLVLIGGASMLAAGRQAQRPQVNLEIVNVRENLYVITGGGGNTGVYVTEKGVVIVDTKALFKNKLSVFIELCHQGLMV